MPKARYLAHGGWLVPIALATWLSAGAAARLQPRPKRPGSGNRNAVCAPRGPNAGAPTLTAAVVSEANDLAFPTRLLVRDPWIFVLDVAADSALHLFRLADGTLYQSLGRRGRGPGEFWSAWSISSDRHSGDAWIYDISLARLTEIVVPSGGRRVAYTGRTIQLAPQGIATGAVWLDSTRLLVPGIFRDARIATFDRSGHRAGGIGQALFAATDARPQVSQARMAMHPDGHLAVLADRHLASIELIDLQRVTATAIQGPVALPHGSAPPGLDDIAYVDVTASATSIFALFSGRSVPTFGQRAAYADCVHVFGWDGTFVGALRLDGDVIAIAVSEDGSALYALEHEPRPALVRFDLPAVSAARPSPLADRVGSPR